MKTKFYSQEDVMQILDVSESTILRWRKDNLIPQPVKVGRRILGWNAEKFDEWLEAQ